MFVLVTLVGRAGAQSLDRVISSQEFGRSAYSFGSTSYPAYRVTITSELYTQSPSNVFIRIASDTDIVGVCLFVESPQLLAEWAKGARAVLEGVSSSSGEIAPNPGEPIDISSGEVQRSKKGFVFVARGFGHGEPPKLFEIPMTATQLQEFVAGLDRAIRFLRAHQN